MLSLLQQLCDLQGCYPVPGVRCQSSANSLWTAIQDWYFGLKQAIRLTTGWYLLSSSPHCWQAQMLHLVSICGLEAARARHLSHLQSLGSACSKRSTPAASNHTPALFFATLLMTNPIKTLGVLFGSNAYS